MKLRILIISFFSFLSLQSYAVSLSSAKELAKANKYQEALVAFRNLIQQPNYAKNAEINKFYGQCLCMTGAYAESLQYLEVGNKGGFYGALWYSGISKQHLYDFEGAIEDLEQYKKRCGKNSSWIPRTDSIISECQLGVKAINRVQDIVVIDSIMVSKQNFFAYYKLGPESGRIEADSTFLACFYDKDKMDKEEISALGGSYGVKYPFMRSDEETLFFACDSVPGLGGYDIYRTTFNSDNNSFFAPTRLPMPFNSPFNDYLLAVDETNQVGWWATDRNANEGFVCIYLFIMEDEASYLEDASVSRARIDCIKETWKNKDGYEDLLQAVRNVDKLIEKKSELIPIRNGIVYTSANDFKNNQARQEYEKYVHIKDMITATKEFLATVRKEYVTNKENRQALRLQILQKEAYLQNLYSQLKLARKEYCRLELEKE